MLVKLLTVRRRRSTRGARTSEEGGLLKITHFEQY